MRRHLQGLSLALDCQAKVTLILDEGTVGESTFVGTSKDLAEPIQVELALERSHPVGREVLGHDRCDKIINLVNHKTPAIGAE